VTEYRLVAEPRVDLDVAGAYQWYENEEPGLGLAFLELAILHVGRDPAEWQRRGG
jgi:hypothetical protein